MALVLWVVIPAMILISTLDIIFVAPVMGVAPWFFIVAVVVSTIYQVLIDGVFAFFCNQIPEKYLKCKRVFNVSKREQKFFISFKLRAFYKNHQILSSKGRRA